MKLFLLLLLCLPGVTLAQQSASVSGFIRDAETGETRIAANVGLMNTTQGASSNRSGFYSITQIKPGTYTLVATFVGYQSYRKEITLSPGQDLRLRSEERRVGKDGEGGGWA